MRVANAGAHDALAGDQGEMTVTAEKITQVPNTFEGACEFVRKHCKRGETPEQAVNRLFRERLKHRGLSGDALSLTAENTEVITETKSKQEFAALDVYCRDGAYDSEAPILIVRYAGDLLIDGHHRCLAWRESRAAGEHVACLMVVREM